MNSQRTESAAPSAKTGTPIRVGIVGANAQRAWALTAHLPAIKAMSDEVVLTAVSARTAELAEEARAAFGASEAFGDSLELVRSPSVDLVVVTVKVPEHRAIVLAALAAGKHVFCEWPLGRDVAEAAEMAAAVPPTSHAIIGLQGLSSPAVRHARQLITDGEIGALKVMRVTSPSISWGDSVPPFYAYLQDKQNGATLETVPGGHTLALIEELVGAYQEIDARSSIRHRLVQVIGTDEKVERTCADHVLVLGLHESGCVSTLEIAGGSQNESFSLVLEGDKGWIKLSGGARAGAPVDYQAGGLLLETSRSGTVQLNSAISGLAGAAINVAQSYARLVHDLRSGERSVPDFQAALRLTRLIAVIERASLAGRQVVDRAGHSREY